MKAYITMTMEVMLPKDLEYLKDVDWGDEDIGLALNGETDIYGGNVQVRMALLRGQDILYNLQIMQPTIEEVIVDD